MLISMGMDTGMIAKSRLGDDSPQELMRVEWNPVMANLQEVEMAGWMAQRHVMPACMAEIDVNAFLQKMVAAQS